MRDDVVIIGGGLAGSEAAWQAASRGARVTLYEMRPKEPTPAHKTGFLAELVCSNSLGSGDVASAPGILKEEMRRLNSLIIRLAASIRTLTQEQSLYFYDAISPIIDADSIDMERVFRASRYDKGSADYLNCPMNQAAYDVFYDALLNAEKVQPKEFEKVQYFESCIPIEVMAERGRQTM